MVQPTAKDFTEMLCKDGYQHGCLPLVQCPNSSSTILNWWTKSSGLLPMACLVHFNILTLVLGEGNSRMHYKSFSGHFSPRINATIQNIPSPPSASLSYKEGCLAKSGTITKYISRIVFFAHGTFWNEIKKAINKVQ